MSTKNTEGIENPENSDWSILEFEARMEVLEEYIYLKLIYKRCCMNYHLYLLMKYLM